MTTPNTPPTTKRFTSYLGIIPSPTNFFKTFTATEQAAIDRLMASPLTAIEAVGSLQAAYRLRVYYLPACVTLVTLGITMAVKRRSIVQRCDSVYRQYVAYGRLKASGKTVDAAAGVDMDRVGYFEALANTRELKPDLDEYREIVNNESSMIGVSYFLWSLVAGLLVMNLGQIAMRDQMEDALNLVPEDIQNYSENKYVHEPPMQIMIGMKSSGIVTSGAKSQ